jgi:hypothetical protein
MTTNGGRQTPALGLGHECDHAWGDDTGQLGRGPDPQYDSAEERRVIAGRERRFALRFGVSPGFDHLGTPYWVAGPTDR